MSYSNEEKITWMIFFAITALIVGLVAGGFTYRLTHLQTITRIEVLEKTCRNVN